MAKLTRQETVRLLRQHRFVKSHAASSMNVDEASIRRLCKKYDIDCQAEQRKLKDMVIKEVKKKAKVRFKAKKARKPLDGGNILIIGDTHEPFCHPGYFDFIRGIRDEYKCSTFVHIGDEVDNHALSFHDHNPEGYSAGDEHTIAYEALHDKWFREFPDMYVCIGNHSALPYRKAMTHGIPESFMKTYQEIWDAPAGWIWDKHFEINGIRFQHGTGKSGMYAHAAWANANRQSTVIGHTHAHAGIKWLASYNSLIFGMNVGCGIDIESYAMVYGDKYANRPTLGCGIITHDGGRAQFIPMEI